RPLHRERCPECLWGAGANAREEGRPEEAPDGRAQTNRATGGSPTAFLRGGKSDRRKLLADECEPPRATEGSSLEASALTYLLYLWASFIIVVKLFEVIYSISPLLYLCKYIPFLLKM